VQIEVRAGLQKHPAKLPAADNAEFEVLIERFHA
jgi:hypothetical protein